MFWNIRKKKENQITQLHKLLLASFGNVKKDTSNLFQWTNFLYQKSLSQENLIKKLEMELAYLPKKPEDIKRIIDSYYSYENLLNRINSLDEKIQKHLPLEIENRIEKLEQQKKGVIRDKVIKRLTKNSKEYIKSLIISYIRKYGQLGAIQLKDMIVLEQGLCSKSSLYRILEEIESLEEIGIIKKGKEKFYLFKVLEQT